MPEPTISTAGAAAAATAAVSPILVVAGVSVGLHAGDLIAGVVGAAAAILFFNAVPSTGDTWRELLRTSGKRVFFALVSAAFAGYVARVAGPLAAALVAKFVQLPAGVSLEEPLRLLSAAIVAAGLQRFLQATLNRGVRTIEGGQA